MTTYDRHLDPFENPWAGRAPLAWRDRYALMVGGALLGVILAAAIAELVWRGDALAVVLRTTLLVIASAAAVWLLGRQLAKLRAAEARYSLVLAAADVGIWDWDVKRDRTFVSRRAQALLGLEPSTALVKRWSEWPIKPNYHPDDWPR